MKEISSDTQVVLNAIKATYDVDELTYPTDEQIAAAVLRAAANQLSYGHGSWAGTSAIIDEDKLLAIANQLENI
jgi:hypothetical protein